MCCLLNHIVVCKILLLLVQSTINPAWNYGSSTNRMVAVSAGSQHLSIVFAPGNDPVNRSLTVFNVTKNITITIKSDTGMDATKIKQIRGTNTLSINFWLVEYKWIPSDESVAIVCTQNFTYMPSFWSRNINTRTYNVFGANTSITYELESTVGCSLNKKIGNSNTSIIISNTSNYTCYNLYYSSGVIYALMYNPSNKTAILKFYNSTTETLISNYTFVTSVLYSDILLTGSLSYYALAYGTKIEIYYASNRTNVCNITLPSNIFDIKISDNWVYVSTSTSIRQYKTQTCMQFDEQTTTVGYYLQYIQITTNSSERLFAWTNTSGIMKVFNISNGYTCVGGCTNCISQYGLNNITKQCYYTGIVSVANSTTNSTTPITITNTTNTTNTTANTTTNTTSNNTIPNNTTIQNNNTIPNANISIPTFNGINLLNISNLNISQIPQYQSQSLPLPQSQSQYSDIEVSLLIFDQYVTWLLQSDAFGSTSQTTAIAAGAASSNPIFQQIFKPFPFLFDQFWLYGYHYVSYPQMFELFTSQNYLFNDLRIKPSFLNFDLDISVLQIQNTKYTKTAQFKSPSLSTLFMLQSLKNVYIYNFFLSFSQFILIVILRYFIKKIKDDSQRLKILYRFLHSNSIWWNLIVSTFQSNIVMITFYVCIQMLCSYSFNFFDKFNLILTALLFFFIFFYSYVIYYLLFRYEKQSISAKILNVSLFGYGGFLLQMSLNCLRRFNSAFIHGLLINHHFLQFLCLIVSDLVMMCIVIKMRKHFRSKFLLFLNFIYFLSFLCLDCILFVGMYVIFADHIQDFQKSPIWNFTIAVFVIFIMAICVVKFIRQSIELTKNFYKFTTLKYKKIQKQSNNIDQKRNLINIENNFALNTQMVFKMKDSASDFKILTKNNRVQNFASEKNKTNVFSSKLPKQLIFKIKISNKKGRLKMETKF